MERYKKEASRISGYEKEKKELPINNRIYINTSCLNRRLDAHAELTATLLERQTKVLSGILAALKENNRLLEQLASDPKQTEEEKPRKVRFSDEEDLETSSDKEVEEEH